MGIFNGNSIYNDGVSGGGGGYADGGQIVDGDFMKIENKAVSTYDNVNRDSLNFYLEPADGEILNAVVELTTAVNSTVKVYVLRNGLYYLLGNVGGDSINAGDQYNLKIIGNSYELENINAASNDPSYIEILGRTYGLIKISNRLWITENFKYRFDDNYFMASDGSDEQQIELTTIKQYDSFETRDEIYYRVNTFSKINDLVASLGLRVPNRSDMESLRNNYTMSQLTSQSDGGSNTTGFNAKFKGICSIYGGSTYNAVYSKKPGILQSGYPAWCFGSSYDRYYLVAQSTNLEARNPNFTKQLANSPSNSDYVNIRLCMDA